MFRDCDYIKIKDGTIFIVVGDQHVFDRVMAKEVYLPDETGDHVDRATGVKYKKKIEEYPIYDSLVAKTHPEYLPTDQDFIKSLYIPSSDIIKHYKPRDKVKECLEKGLLRNTKWEKLISTINEVAGIPFGNIGIYGSYLVELNNDDSDVDILVYGKENLGKLRDHFDEIILNVGIRKASREQRIARVATWEKYSAIDIDRLQKMESRRWSRLNVYGDDITSIRFIYNEDEVPLGLITSPVIRGVKTRGVVAESIRTHFCPRIAKIIIDGNKTIEVISYGFLFFSCVSDGDEVEILGNYRKDGQREYITLDNPSHYMCPITEYNILSERPCNDRDISNKILAKSRKTP
ncbi:MAG: nucleotidyltransferase domain-containing protein [bacterium]|nr:nucleotidyltransferase domain-containing protein [bacterium]